MSNLIVVREAFDWLEAAPNHSFTFEDMQELIRYMDQLYPGKNWMEIGYKRVRFINVVGTIRLSKVQIDIIPKLNLDSKLDDHSALTNMLTTCGHVPYKVGYTKASVQESQMDLLTWIADSFCTELQEQLKRGLPNDYMTVGENTTKLKGKIHVAAHIRHNLADRSKVYCIYDERNYTVPLNLIFYKTLLVLKQTVYEPTLRKTIIHLCGYYEGLTLPSKMKHIIEQVRFDRQTARFEKAFRLAKLILSNMSVMNQGVGEESLSFLFEVNILYETYIGKVLSDLLLSENAIVRLQHKEMKLLKNDDTKKDNVQLIPDIVVGHADKDGHIKWSMIMDTKWKLSRYQQNDIYQMYAYVTGYSDATRAILLYPQTNDTTNLSTSQNWSLNGNSAKRIHIRTIRIGNIEETKEDLRGILLEFGVM
ncbi:McrC family protein [Paenibacillus azoreducens]|uniref:McrC family protein n=1 Tax=Paenibacillus azoreducens TaxID=116718 RepID=UPI0039F58AF4